MPRRPSITQRLGDVEELLTSCRRQLPFNGVLVDEGTQLVHAVGAHGRRAPGRQQKHPIQFPFATGCLALQAVRLEHARAAVSSSQRRDLLQHFLHACDARAVASLVFW